MNSPIGIFDSGVGGLTVLREIRRLMPNEPIIYVGDTARAPYGGKDEETLRSYGRDIIRFFLERNVKAVVMACGTSSSTSFEQLSAEFPNLPMVDTIRPGVKAAEELIKAKPETRLGFIATEATVKNGLFERLLLKKCPGVTFHARACPMFAPMTEAGLAGIPNHPLPIFAAKNYLADLRGQIDALVLGCTHYPLLTDALIHALGDVTFINPAIATAQAAKDLLAKSNILCDNDVSWGENSNATVEYCTSGSTEAFCRNASAILNEDCTPIKITFTR